MLNSIVALIISYVLGAIPFGLIIVKVFTGKDIRAVASGRTGGTNAMRAAGLWAGILTGAMDVLKGVATGWVTGWMAPENIWLRVAAAILAIIGHNYSIFLIEKRERGGFRLRGGAGGATALGGAIALWPESGLIIFPLGFLVYILVGYASITTISVAVFATLIFAVRTFFGSSPWQYILYGIVTYGIVIIALKPNLQRLKEGTERAVGLRAKLEKQGSNR
jgi:glycerol-3-phosphate acyltransferase PlsY